MKDTKKFKFGEISSLAFGTWKIGGEYWSPDYSKDKEWIEAIKKGIELGITTIDTAEMYGGGHAEEIVAKAIKDFKREELFIVTKVWPSNASYEGTIKSAKASMKRLGTYIDLYLLHGPSTFDISETMRAFEKLVDEGIIRYFGLSNFEVEGIKEAMQYLKKYEIVAIQNYYSLKHRDDERSVIPFAQKNGLLYMAYTPLEQGRLAKNKFLEEIGKKYNKTAAQVALNWYIMIENVIPIVKASKIEHVEENAGALGWRLNESDWKSISDHFK